jgi:Asp-tRNA(Asn)/Glu-tRNA(Gln) amidotransferase B subunit
MGQRKCSINEVGLAPSQLASLVDAVQRGEISNKIAKDIFPDMLGTESSADDIIAAKGLRQVSDEGALRAMVADVIANNPDNLEKYKAGRTNLFGFFVGQVIKASNGTANPSLVSSMMKEALDELTS